MSISATRSNFFENMIAVMPGVLKDHAGQLHFYGSSAEQINWLLDGFNIAGPSSGELETGRRRGCSFFRSLFRPVLC